MTSVGRYGAVDGAIGESPQAAVPTRSMPATTVVNPRKVIAIDNNRRSRQTARSAVGARPRDNLVQLAVVKPHQIAHRTAIQDHMARAIVPVGDHLPAAFRSRLVAA